MVATASRTGFVLKAMIHRMASLLRVYRPLGAEIAPHRREPSRATPSTSARSSRPEPIAQGINERSSYRRAVEVGFAASASAASHRRGINTTITIDDFYIEVDLDLGGMLGSCTLEGARASCDQGSYDLVYLASEPTRVDVNLVSPISVTLVHFSPSSCPHLRRSADEDMVNFIIGQGDIEQRSRTASRTTWRSDGAVSLGTALAAAIESAGGISIAGPVGEALGGTLDAPIVSVVEGRAASTVLADAAFTTSSPSRRAGSARFHGGGDAAEILSPRRRGEGRS